MDSAPEAGAEEASDADKAQQLASVRTETSPPEPESSSEDQLRSVLRESLRSGDHARRIAEIVGIYPC